MAVNETKYKGLTGDFKDKHITLVAVSKTKPIEDIMELYRLGQRDFGENYVQELIEKQPMLPQDTRWHFIGHLQTNKVKYIAPFVSLIESVDSLKLLKEIDKQALKNNRVIDCLLQVHIAQEETKFGLDEKELAELMTHHFDHARILGLMGMATFTDEPAKVKKEFQYLKSLFDKYPSLQTLSMGMSSDYKIAIEEGSSMVRIGSLIFGERIYDQ
jgi:pyridoxal phosphate enzyme (YggS family)